MPKRSLELGGQYYDYQPEIQGFKNDNKSNKDLVRESLGIEKSISENLQLGIPYKNAKSYSDFYDHKSESIPEGLGRIDMDMLKQGYPEYRKLKGNYLKYNNRYYYPLYANELTNKKDIDNYLKKYSLDINKFTIVPNSEIKSLIPKRDYIGGNPIESRLKMVSKLGLDDKIANIAKKYNINKNLLLNRFIHEGYIDEVINAYNSGWNEEEQKEIISDKSLDKFVNGFANFGFDFTAKDLRNGNIKILDPNVKWESKSSWKGDFLNELIEARDSLADYKNYFKNDSIYYPSDIYNSPKKIKNTFVNSLGVSNEKGQMTDAVDVHDLNSALNIMAGHLRMLQNSAENKGYKGNRLDIQTNAMYNLGENHPDLQNDTWINNRYRISNHFNTLDSLKRANNFRNGGIINTPVRREDIRPTLANGGGIYIKPSHRGRLTELKARTGKTESELYNDGNPAHKKMVVFARNARKWNH